MKKHTLICTVFASVLLVALLCGIVYAMDAHDTPAGNSYQTPCPICGIHMALACDDHRDDRASTQELCWNYYVCDACEYVQRGAHDDDLHNEEDCDLPCISDYHADWVESKSASFDAVSESPVWDKDFDEAIVAGDYCDIHDCFGCEVMHD